MGHRETDRTPFWLDGARGFQEHHDAWWEAPLQAFLLLLVVALVVVGIVWLVRRLGPPSGAGAGAAVGGGVATPALVDDGAVAALRLRYARGDVDRDTYLTAFADLTGRGEPWPGQVVATPDTPTEVPPV